MIHTVATILFWAAVILWVLYGPRMLVRIINRRSPYDQVAQDALADLDARRAEEGK